MKTFKNETTRAWLVMAVLLIAPAVAALADEDAGFDDYSSYPESSRDEDDSAAQEDYGAVAVPTYRGGYGYSYGSPPVMIVRPRPGMRTFGGTTWTGDGTVCFSGASGTSCY